MNTSYIKQFNRYAQENKSLIRKALDSASGTAEALIPEHLEQIITNTVVRLSPELAMVQPKFDNQKYHEFNRLLTLPAAGGAMGENAVTPTRNATYERSTVQLKIIRRKGAVTNFLADTSEKYIDAAAAEMENHLLAHTYDLSTYLVHGNAGADAYTFDGIGKMVETNRINEVAAGVVPTDLSFLDDMIDENLDRQGMNHNKAFLMSPKMLSKVSSLLTNVRLNQGLSGGGLTQVDVGGGWRLNAYRDIPIIVSSQMRPKATMGTVTTATAASGGTIPADEYFFRVSYVDYNGESTASAEVSRVTSGSTSTLTLSWADVPSALYYKIYCGLATGGANTKLVKVISANSYDGSGTIGSRVTSHVFTTNPSTVDSDSVTSAMEADIPKIATGGVPPEDVILWDLDEYQGLGKMPYTNSGGSRFNGLVTITPLAITDDFVPFMTKTYAALCPSFEATSVIHRGLRVA
jgi:hypothetical protein